jgi:hypothetical protein
VSQPRVHYLPVPWQRAGSVAKTGPAFLIQSDERQDPYDHRGRLVLAVDIGSLVPSMTAVNAHSAASIAHPLQTPAPSPKRQPPPAGSAGRTVLSDWVKRRSSSRRAPCLRRLLERIRTIIWSIGELVAEALKG